MTVDLVPLSLFSERHKQGWRMRPGYELKAGDYAVLMQSPGFEETESNHTKANRTNALLGTKARQEKAKAKNGGWIGT